MPNTIQEIKQTDEAAAFFRQYKIEHPNARIEDAFNEMSRRFPQARIHELEEALNGILVKDSHQQFQRYSRHNSS